MPQGIETVRSKFHQLMKCFWAGVLSRRFLKKATAAPAKAPGNWEKTHSLALGTRETQHRHGYKQSLSQSLSGISLFVGAFPKGQHLSALQHFQWLPLLTIPHSSWKARRGPYTPLMLETLGDTHLECLHQQLAGEMIPAFSLCQKSRIFTNPDMELC